MKKYLAFFFFCYTLIFSVWESHAQCTVKKRVYANRTETALDLTTSVNNEERAIDGNPKTYSKLNVPIGVLNLINATQFLEFRENGNPKTIPANTAVTIKLTLPRSIAGVLDNVTIQPFTNLRHPFLSWVATPAGNSFTSGDLLNVINGAGEIEVKIKPTASFNGVWINLGSLVGLGVSINIFHAYIEEDDNSPSIICDVPIDVLSGVKPVTSIGGVANSTGVVNNPWDAVDSDINYKDTYTELNLGVQVLSEVFETVIFNTPSQKNDVVEIILQKSDGSLLDLNLLTNFSVQPYLGTQTAGSNITNTSTFLSLSLLSGSPGNNKYLLRARIPEIFDRVEIKMGGVAGLLSSLKIYDVRKKVSPAVSLNGTEIKNISICEGESITLTTETQLCTTFKWYNVATGGTALHTGNTLSINNVTTTTTYYVEAIRGSVCSNINERVPVTVNVNPSPSISLGTMPQVCEFLTQAKIPFSNLLHSPSTYKIVWEQVALDAGFENIEENLPNGSEIQISIPVNIAPDAYNGSLTVKNANDCTSTAQNVQITIKPTPNAPNLTIQTHSQY